MLKRRVESLGSIDFLVLAIAVSRLFAASVGAEDVAFADSIHVEGRAERGVKLADHDYSGARVGAAIWRERLGLWGYAEALQGEDEARVKYGELATRIALTEPLGLTLAYGGGDDARYRPSHVALATVEYRLASIAATPQVGYTREQYDRSIFEYARLHWFQDVGMRWRLGLNVQRVRQSNKSGGQQRHGYSGGGSVAWTAGWTRLELGILRSCLSSSVACEGRLSDEYAETSLAWRQGVTLLLSVTGSLTWVEKSAEWLRVTGRDGEQPSVGQTTNESRLMSLGLSYEL